MIDSAETLSHFQRLLTTAGFDTSPPDPALAWRVFKDFSAIPVDAATDGLLFQCGTFHFTGAPLFEFDFTRQFTHEVADADDVDDVADDADDTADDEPGDQRVEQLACTFFYASTDELRALDTNLWSFAFETREDFFPAVEALPEFQAVMAGPVPLRAAVTHEQV